MPAKLSQEEFIRRVESKFPDRFDCSYTSYESLDREMEIRCKKHNILFKQIPRSILDGKRGCIHCKRELRKNRRGDVFYSCEDFRKQVKEKYGDLYVPDEKTSKSLASR